MKDGYALCTKCGKKPEKKEPIENISTEKNLNLEEILGEKNSNIIKGSRKRNRS